MDIVYSQIENIFKRLGKISNNQHSLGIKLFVLKISIVHALLYSTKFYGIIWQDRFKIIYEQIFYFPPK